MTSELYLRVREREGRLYPDEIVRALPKVPPGHPLSGEWRARAASLAALRAYLNRLARPLRMLELGCGNGWLSHQLSTLPGLLAWGLDRRGTELTQAARLFNEESTAFLAADIFRAPFGPRTFDIILLPSVIQYFPDLPRLIRSLQGLARDGGELHILDSPIYDAADVQQARERTQTYYAALGLPEMAAYYFHHTVQELREFAPHWLYRPDSMKASVQRMLGGALSPFPWLCVR